MSDDDKEFLAAWGILTFVIGGLLWSFTGLNILQSFFAGLGIGILWIGMGYEGEDTNR